MTIETATFGSLAAGTAFLDDSGVAWEKTNDTTLVAMRISDCGMANSNNFPSTALVRPLADAVVTL